MAGNNQGVVNVVDPDGNLGSLPADQAADAIKNAGFRQAAPDDIEAFDDQQKYGTGAAPIKAFGLGALDSSTFGMGTEAAVHAGMLDPVAARKLQEQNPVASGAGKLAGIVGSVAMLPEEGLVGAVGAIGKAVEGGAAAVLPEATGLAARVLKGAATKAIGNAAEGAFYSAGNLLNEHALGDPDLNAEKIMGEMGHDAVLFGGLGAVLGAAGGALSKRFPGFVSELAKGTDDLSEAAPADLAPEKEGIVDGLRKLKPNAQEIKDAAAEIGAPVLEGQLSASQQVQRAEDLLQQSPTATGIARQQTAQKGMDAATDAVTGVVRPADALSKVETGNAIKEEILSQAKAEQKVVSELYDTLKQGTDQIPIADAAKTGVQEGIEATDAYKFSGTVGREIGDYTIKNLDNIKTVDDIKRFTTELYKKFPMNKGDVGQVADFLNKLHDNSVVEYAEKAAEATADPEAKQQILDLLEQKKAANAQYRGFAEKYGDIGESTGKRKFRGPQDFIDHIDDQDPEKLVDKLFPKNRSEFLERLQQNFPQVFELGAKYQKQAMLTARGVMDGEKINAKALLKNIFDDKVLSPEVRAMMFKPEELTKLGAAKTYLESMPKSFNPSGTSAAHDMRNFFSKVVTGATAGGGTGAMIAGPGGALVGGVLGGLGGASKEIIRDNVMKKFIEWAVHGGDIPDAVGRMAEIERKINKASSSVDSLAGRLLDTGSSMVHGVANTVIVMSHDEKERKLEKVGNQLNTVLADPGATVEHMAGVAESLQHVAPYTAQAIQITALRGAQFLKSKMPNTAPAGPLMPDRRPSDAELSKFFRYHAIVENPYIALKQVKDGTLTSESLEALHTVYPRLAQEMSQSVLEKLVSRGDRGRNLPYSMKVMLSKFLGNDLTGTMNPQALQANMAAAGAPSSRQDVQPAAGKNPSRAGAAKLTLAERSQGELGKVETRSRG